MKLRINANNKNNSIAPDAASANAYRNKFVISLDIEMVDSVIPYYQSGLDNRLL